jgi:hypothetical protein
MKIEIIGEEVEVAVLVLETVIVAAIVPVADPVKMRGVRDRERTQ